MDSPLDGLREKRSTRDSRPPARAAMPAAVLVLAAVVVILVTLFAAGCGGGSSSSTSQPATSQPAGSGAVQVLMKNIAFTPAQVTVKVGQTVTWTNEDSAQHDVVANDASFKSVLLDKGQTFSFTFTKAGTFDYYCAVHPQMKGTVTVQP